MNDSRSLALQGKQCWFMDLDCALRLLPIPIVCEPLYSLDIDGVERVRKLIRSTMKRWLNNEMASSKFDTLHGRLEPDKDFWPRHVTIMFRHYLKVPNVLHRKL